MGVLDGKGAVVTGGSRGIGRAIVERLTGDGAIVVFNYARSADAAADVARTTGAHAVQADLAEPAAAERLMRIAAERIPGLDILVNNAAIDGTVTPLADTTEDQWNAAMNVNARTAFLTVRYAAREMRDDGRIINISTMNTTRPARGNAPYAASKGAIEQLTRVAAMELGVRGITANAVCPGATDTELLRGANPPESIELVRKVTPLGRLGRPADIADVVAALAGPDGRWLTGQIINVGGGLA